MAIHKKLLKNLIPKLFIQKYRKVKFISEKNLKKILFKSRFGIKIWQIIWALSLLRFKSFRELYFLSEKSDICFDLGANIGEATVVLWLKGVKRIYSIEPHPIAFKKLKINLSNIRNIQFFNVGISSKNSIEKLYLNSDLVNKENELADLGLSKSASVIKDKTNNGDLYYEAVMNTLDDFIKNVDVLPTLIKCDIEGGEYLIYHQFIKLARSDTTRLILVETHHQKLKMWDDEHLIFIKDIKKYGLERKFNLEWH